MPGLMMGILLFMVSVQAGADGIGESERLLTGVETTKHFEIRYRPGARAGAAVDRIAHLVDGEYERIVETLKIKGKVEPGGPFLLFIYDSADELSRITGVQGTGGFSAGRESHIPFDNDQTRLHEMVHIVVAAMKPAGPEARNMFFVEGLANAVLEFVHGVPVHAVAAYEKKRGSLPALEVLEAQESFYAYLQENPGFNGYDVGGSFMRFLLDTYGPERTMKYYHGVPVQKALNASLKAVEKKWHAFLDGYVLRPELEILLSQRRGDGGSFAPLGSAGEPLSEEVLGDPKEWRSFQSLLEPLDHTESWAIGKEKVRGTSSSGADWFLCEASGRRYKDCMIRGRIKAVGACWGVQVRLGKECQAMVLGQGAFIYYKEKGGKAFTEAFRLQENMEIDLVLRVQGGRADVWINGEHWLEADVEVSEASPGIGVVGGTAEFRDLEVRPLR